VNLTNEENLPTTLKLQEKNLPRNVESPPHSIKVRFKLKKLEIVVRLQKIPAHTINLVPTTTEFYLDTFKYSKKYHLSFKYPQDIRVDADDCEVVFEGGFLKITLPIIEIKDYATGKMIRKKGLRSQLHKQESLEIKDNKKKTKRQSAKVAEQPNSQNEKRDNLATLELIENINKDEDKKTRN